MVQITWLDYLFPAFTMSKAKKLDEKGKLSWPLFSIVGIFLGNI